MGDFIEADVTESEALAAIFADLDKRLGRPALAEGEVTARMVAKRMGITHKAARDALNVLVEEGKYAKREVFVDGHWNNAYRKLNRTEA